VFCPHFILVSLLPELDLPDLLLEVHQLTGFADAFTHISEKQARMVLIFGKKI